MIKLVTLLKEIETEQSIIAKLSPEDKQKYEQALAILQDETLDEGVKDSLKKLGLSAAIIGALLATPSLGAAQKAAVKDLKAQTSITTMNPSDPTDIKNVDSNYMKWALGTSDDGILGQYTSQFKFPNARLKVDDKIIQLGLKDNTTLDVISNFDKGKMDQWNKFVDWMKASKVNGKTISGNPELDTDPNIGLDVINAYKETPAGKNFWVNGEKDIKEIQRFIKAYRAYTIADWRAGAKDPKGRHGGIELRK